VGGGAVSSPPQAINPQRRPTGRTMWRARMVNLVFGREKVRKGPRKLQPEIARESRGPSFYLISMIGISDRVDNFPIPSDESFSSVAVGILAEVTHIATIGESYALPSRAS
jgi:hypothetical protein